MRVSRSLWPPQVDDHEPEQPVRPFAVERRRLAPRPKKPEKAKPKPAKTAPKHRRPMFGAPRMKSGEWDYHAGADEDDAP